MKHSVKLTAFFLCAALLLSACGSGGASQTGGVSYITVEADSGGNLVLDTSGVTEYATYVNYEADGTVIQLILVRDSSGTLHYAFNTCQSCTPSPKAYFVQEGSSFICQNCGNSFTVEQVGSSSGGCNPANIASAEENGDTLTIPADYLAQYSGNFAYWQGPTSA